MEAIRVINSHGEVITDQLSVIKVRAPKHEQDFVMFWTENLASLAFMRLTGEQMRVWFVLISHTEYTNRVFCTGRTISDLLRISPANVSNALKVLVEKDLIRLYESDGGVKFYRINPCFVWRGTTKLHRQALKEWFSSDPAVPILVLEDCKHVNPLQGTP